MFSVGSVEGVPFTACTSGPDIIILASNFARVQQITASSPISSLDCSTDVGKIAAAYDNKMVIFEPIPLVQQPPKLDYKWVQTAIIESETSNSVMSFNLEGNRLIAGGKTLQLWVLGTTSKTSWHCAWRCKTATTISYLRYSPDGTLFCSASKSDRLVKIWYESATNSPSNMFDFSFIYIAHPSSVTGLEWRRTSKYTPRGAVANILITSCKDNIARIWVQTLLPDDGLVNFNQLKISNCEEDLVNGAPRVQTQRHRQKLLRRLKRMKAFSQFKKRQALALDHSIDELEKVASNTINTIHDDETVVRNIPNANGAIQSNGVANNNNTNTANATATSNPHNTVISTALSAHDFHSYALCSTVIKPGLHFHLAGVIEVDAVSSSSKLANLHRTDSSNSAADAIDEDESPFVVHWINNKEIHITRSIELLLHDMLIRILKGNNLASSSTNSPHSAGESCSGSENDTDEPENPNDDTITAESSKKLRHKLCRKMNKQRALAASGRRDPGADLDENARASLNPTNGRASPTSLVEEFDKTLESLLKRWQTSADLLFSIDKSNGTLTLWQVKYLDGEDTGVFRHVQIDKLSHLEDALPHHDATTMSLNITAYSPSAYLDVKRAYLAVTSSSGIGSTNNENFIVGDQFPPVDVPEILSINIESASIEQAVKPGLGSVYESKDNISSISISDAEPSIFLVTQHLSGILGLWKLISDSASPKVHKVDLVTRITGLPIDPSWLRDGILVVEYHDNEASLITKWLPDESGKHLIQNISKIPQARSSFYNFDEIKSSLVCSLPSVDEEDASKPVATRKPSQEESQVIVQDSYKASQLASIIQILPQYHLKQLMELLAFGKLQRVKAILNHLVSCLLQMENASDKETDSAHHSGGWPHRSRTLSIVAQSAPSIHNSFDIDNPSSSIQQQVLEEIELDYIEVTSIKPLPLYSLIEADTEKSNPDESQSSRHEEFSASYESIMQSRSQVDETLDEILGKSTIETLNKQKELKRLASETPGKGSLTSFNPRKAKLLTRVLTHTHLPGLSNVDQMHLLAVADAVAMFDASPNDLNELHDEDGGSHGGGSMISTNIAIDSLDDRGLRFLTAMRQHVYLTRCLPMKQRNELKASGIGNHNLVWAFHSESQDELISLIPCVQRNKPEWAEIREFGIGWWLKKLEVLRKLIEKVAQSAYQARQDPLDAALFYLAMKKKTLVCALLRRVNCDKRLLKLFEQDFNDPVNRKKALKNAYALLGLHRFEHAAAFFILAGSIWDAVEVCINNLNDIQLAMVLIRLHDNDLNLPANLRRLLFTEILGAKRPVEVPGAQAQVAQNSGLRNSQERRASNVGSQYTYDPKCAHQDPFLRSMAFWKLGDYLSSVHTLLESDVGHQRRPSSVQVANLNINQNPISRGNSISGATSALESSVVGGVGSSGDGLGGAADDGSISASVFNFYLFLKDQPLVTKHKQQLLEEIEIKKRTSPVDEEPVHCHRARSLSSGELGFDERGLSRAIKQSSTEFEVLNETTRLVDKYSDEAIAEKERRLFFSTAQVYLEAGCPLLALEVLNREDHLNMSKAQRMKFLACLHILMNELETLASPSSQDFFDWLKQSLDAIKKICSYAGTARAHGTHAHTSWVEENDSILRSMLTYCNLHQLTTVRLAVLALLKEPSFVQSK